MTTEQANKNLPTTLAPTVGRIVHFTPPQDCTGKTTLEFYPAMVTQVNPNGTVELATFGPNSLYFQHGVEVSDTPTPGTCNWPTRQ